MITQDGAGTGCKGLEQQIRHSCHVTREFEEWEFRSLLDLRAHPFNAHYAADFWMPVVEARRSTLLALTERRGSKRCWRVRPNTQPITSRTCVTTMNCSQSGRRGNLKFNVQLCFRLQLLKSTMSSSAVY